MDKLGNIRRSAALIVMVAAALIVTACSPVLPWAVITSSAKGTVAPTAAPATATPAPTEVSPRMAAVCPLAYVAGNRVFCQTPDGKALEVGAVQSPANQPVISPDGEYVAFSETHPDGNTSLYVARPDGSGARLLVAPGQLAADRPEVVLSPILFAWRPESHTLYFETGRRYADTKDQAENGVSLDLWTVDANSGAVEMLYPAGSVGRFTFSPNGKYAVLSGPQTLALLDIGTGKLTRVLDFDAIDNRTPAGYMPVVTWSSESGTFLAVIPSRDPYAADATATVYRFALDGSSQKLGSLSGSFLLNGVVDFAISPDRAHLVYGTFDFAGSQTSALHMANIDGSDDRVIEQVDRDGGLAGLGWSPDSAHYLYSILPVNRGRIAGVDGGAEDFAPGMAVFHAEWVDASSFYFYFYGYQGTAAGYYLQRLGQAPQSVFGDVPEAGWFDYRQSQEQP